MRQVNTVVIFAVDSWVLLRFPKLYVNSLEVVGFSDASFYDNRDFTSQLGCIFFINDYYGHDTPLALKSYKPRHVTISVMGEELKDFRDMYDAAYMLVAELCYLNSCSKVPVQLLTGRKTLFDIIIKGRRT